MPSQLSHTCQGWRDFISEAAQCPWEWVAFLEEAGMHSFGDKTGEPRDSLRLSMWGRG